MPPLYTLGWVSDTGGSITAKVHDDSVPKSDQLIIMSPSDEIRVCMIGVQKERMVEEDMYVLLSFVYCLITHMEMIKGIQGHGYYDELVVPIIENTAHERELT
ncbi:putative methylthioribulose-1-phosphate dehydratase, class II aldolase/adducin domain superfamily [Helianthus annuus]|uniref:Methylthioribulose-1-phosphate dehydratase, class II aldolase/adducin domain superfamily n=1 Tax=Helianthus annuus TaxID=4232 RepID=A0A251VNF7_HELAN|nr:putative methylthioribulose-1-phosphate dehydratase, class II aldolase/adducin domain superfamily [Helianthus annuus]KAJ0611711.1 putative methylthioribulose-1-phosphate dehydratase, class II aldolase/adducin domain superfamily [Helianthus annuus]KAJ0622838.1 putative methylthioribulose-1-phosphate dehydratase, class II aldolase/adducin domain superfamily [Helianthus annuus]KAJ0627034.1 putative methylthioribulose-1-phosphate dehydratase, class II aldolase/adducin domain superfamily [Helianth